MQRSLRVSYEGTDRNLAKKWMLLGRWLKWSAENRDNRVKEVTIHPDSYAITSVEESAANYTVVMEHDLISLNGRIISETPNY